MPQTERSNVPCKLPVFIASTLFRTLSTDVIFILLDTTGSDETNEQSSPSESCLIGDDPNGVPHPEDVNDGIEDKIEVED